MKKAVVIVAGGSGLRMGTDIPKQFLLLSNKPVLMYTIEAFIRYDSALEIILVLPESQIEYWERLCTEHNFSFSYKLAQGGQTRFQSVKNGLALIERCDVVGIHDGVRPFVAAETLTRCYNTAWQFGSAIPVMPVVESLRKLEADGNIGVDRATFRSVQTPQVFKWELLQNAYSVPFDNSFTDDASVVEKQGVSLQLVEGNGENIKITSPLDLKIGELILGE